MSFSMFLYFNCRYAWRVSSNALEINSQNRLSLAMICFCTFCFVFLFLSWRCWFIFNLCFWMLILLDKPKAKFNSIKITKFRKNIVNSKFTTTKKSETCYCNRCNIYLMKIANIFPDLSHIYQYLIHWVKGIWKVII